MIRLINQPEGISPSGLSSYNIKKYVLRDLFDVAKRRYNDYMDIILNYMEGKRRISNSEICQYTIEEHILSSINHWDLRNKGIMLNRNIRFFELDKCDGELIPYKQTSTGIKGIFSLFVSKGWLEDESKCINIMLKIADHCILDSLSDNIPIGQWDSIWLNKYFESDLSVMVFAVEYYVTLFDCILASSSKVTLDDIHDCEDYQSPFNDSQEKLIWDYANKLENHVDVDSDYSNLMVEIYNLK